MATTQREPEVEVHLEDLEPIEQFRREHKTAVLVIMFTDLKGSTELAEQRGEVYSQNVRLKHDALLREIIERDGTGRIIKNIGDSLMCLFAEPTAAVERAVAIQQMLTQYNAAHSNDAAMQVRIGIHLGQVVVEEKVQPDVFGRHVNRAARVESLADGGQILLTLPIYDSAHGWLTERKLVWRDHGDYWLKGIDEPTRIFEVCPAGVQPRVPVGRRVSRRSWLGWVAAAVVVGVAVPAGWSFRPAPVPLNPRLDIRVLRDQQVFVDLLEAVPLRAGDKLQVIGRLDRPAYACLFWQDQDGEIHVVADSQRERVRQIAFPQQTDSWVALEGKPGTEMIGLATGDAPLEIGTAFAAKMKSRGPLPDFVEPAALWLTPERNTLQVHVNRGPGKIDHQESKNLEYRFDQLRQLLHQELTDFRAVAIPHW